MWIFTKYGFYSAACTPSALVHGLDRLVIRARVRSHLEALIKRFPGQLGACEIQDGGGTDYAHRIYVGGLAWQIVMAHLTLDIDYDNFKEEVARHQAERGGAGAAYEESLHKVWHVMHELQLKR